MKQESLGNCKPAWTERPFRLLYGRDDMLETQGQQSPTTYHAPQFVRQQFQACLGEHNLRQLITDETDEDDLSLLQSPAWKA